MRFATISALLVVLGLVAVAPAQEVIPMLRKQSGFRDEITFALPGGLDVVAISLWDTKDCAEAYNTAGYPEVLKILDKVLDGTPKVQVSDVISSTIHKPAAVAA
jgi:hypothetical protein